MLAIVQVALGDRTEASKMYVGAPHLRGHKKPARIPRCLERGRVYSLKILFSAPRFANPTAVA